MSSPKAQFGSTRIIVPNENGFSGDVAKELSNAPNFSFPLPFNLLPRCSTEIGSYTEHIIQHSPSLIVSIDPDGATISMNEAGCRITGYDCEELIGKNRWSTIYPGDKYQQLA